MKCAPSGRGRRRSARWPQIIRALARPRPEEAPAGVKPVLRLQAPRDGRDGDRGPGAGPRRRPATSDLDDMIILRSDGDADLQLRRRGRRSRHGRHPRHPRRRSPDQRRPPDADLQRHGLGRRRVFAHVPLIHGPDGAKLSKRHGALGHRGLSRHGLSAGGAAQLPGAARLEPRRRRDLLHRAGRRSGSTSTTSTRRRAGSTSPSSPTSTATTSARPATPSCAAPQGPAARPRRRRRARAPGSSGSAGTSWRPRCPRLKERAKTLLDLIDGAGLPDRRAPAHPRRQGGQGSSMPRPAAPWPSCCRGSKRTADWHGPGTGGRGARIRRARPA